MKKHKEIWLLVGAVFTIWLILTLIDNKRIETTNYDIKSNKIKNECTISATTTLTIGKISILNLIFLTK